ncbi:MAG: hypothetical protein JSW40_02110 [Candidatus Omnitrophota bacterium]|nr:MAG: hypothetical protein JSW40_02110 [Candidatus Omnitrophota bacterium]
MSIADSQKETIKSKILECLESEGMELVELRIFHSQGRYTVRALIDYPQGGVTLDECAKLNSKIFSFLEKSNELGQHFIVEVNSPGLDRPLKNQQDFLKAEGRALCLWLNEPVEGKQYYEGKLKKADEEGLQLETKGHILTVSYSQVKLGKEKII